MSAPGDESFIQNGPRWFDAPEVPYRRSLPPMDAQVIGQDEDAPFAVVPVEFYATTSPNPRTAMHQLELGERAATRAHQTLAALHVPLEGEGMPANMPVLRALGVTALGREGEPLAQYVFSNNRQPGEIQLYADLAVTIAHSEWKRKANPDEALQARTQVYDALDDHGLQIQDTAIDLPWAPFAYARNSVIDRLSIEAALEAGMLTATLGLDRHGLGYHLFSVAQLAMAGAIGRDIARIGTEVPRPVGRLVLTAFSEQYPKSLTFAERQDRPVSGEAHEEENRSLKTVLTELITDEPVYGTLAAAFTAIAAGKSGYDLLYSPTHWGEISNDLGETVKGLEPVWIVSAIAAAAGLPAYRIRNWLQEETSRGNTRWKAWQYVLKSPKRPGQQ